MKSTAGVPSDNDTLNITGANGLGLTVVDLSAADQISQLNGAVNSAVQAGVESIDLSGLTGAYGSNITGSSDANTITATGNADVINPGEGIDTVNGKGGADTITITETTSKADTIQIAEAEGGDVITGYTAGTDKIDLSVALIDDDNGARDAAGFGATKALAAANFLALDDTDLNAATGFNAGEDVVLEIVASLGTVGSITAAAFHTAYDTKLDVKTANDQVK